MTSRGIRSTNTTEAWHNHCLSAVRRFVMNAVVIDNQPKLATRDADTVAPQTAVPSEDGMGLNDTDTDADEVEAASDGNSAIVEAEVPRYLQDLDIRGISDAFAQNEISCAFVLPNDDTDHDDDAIVKRVLAAAIPSDIVIVDWYLRDNDPLLTEKILRKIAENDVAERGRMRLICIYTGMPQMTEVFRLAKECLEKGGLSFRPCDDVCLAHGPHHCLMVLNKQEVGCGQLPTKLLEGMTKLADGLLPAFSMAAVAAVRRNMHHIITRFSSDLDSAFVANMLITDPPTDVAELMRELFASECDTALGLEKVLDNFLGTSEINYWLDRQGQPKANTNYECEVELQRRKGLIKEKRTINIDRALLNSILEKGPRDVVYTEELGDVEFPEERRDKISHALHGEKNESKKRERDLARFVVFKREAFGNTKLSSEEWLPSLTLGTLLRRDVDNNGQKHQKYYYCLTPACDTVRLAGTERTFQFLELEEATKTANLLVAEEGGKLKRLFMDPKPINLRSFLFEGSPDTGRAHAKRMVAEGSADLIFCFESAGAPPSQFVWLGETRRNRANRDMAELNRNWLRLGIRDSEYLRLAGRGKFKI